MPAISVIVPLYNKAAYVDRCLDAILGQSFTDFELIVVNDGSTDGSEKIVARRKDARLKLVSQANAGPGPARNHGVKLATSTLLAFLDSDDAWHPDYLKETVDKMASLPEDAATLTWGMKNYPRDESTERRWKDTGVPDGMFRARPDSDAGVIIAMLAAMMTPATVIRKAPFDELGGFYAKYRCLYSEDTWLYLKLMLRYAAAFDSRPLTFRYEDAAELSMNLQGVRPIEPFLLDPGSVTDDCPPGMAPLLREVLARRALKTASVYGYWGEFRKARQLFRGFVSPKDWRLPWFATSLASCTPLTGWVGGLARAAGHRKGGG
ncbi:MAG TPA: glycosyltransferase family A protein [Bryobacteraceae bacterium]|jgi:glycosyltransferase involved in cell wall biosynthesis|nr:glycosyltransferase family A protein [Bryobacteraceae bacterium]